VSDQTPALSTVEPARRRAGRPPAKHSSPDYTQITVYVPKNVRNAVKVRLFQEGLELSALVERLLATWLITQAPAEAQNR
jgi:hypothetical protein